MGLKVKMFQNGSQKCLVQLPSPVMQMLGYNESETVEFDMTFSGRSIVLTPVTKEE